MPAGGMPPLSHFEASFDVWAPAQPHNQSTSDPGYDLEALGVPRVAPLDQLEHNGARYYSGGGLLPTLEMRHPTLQLPPEVWERDAEQDDTPGGEAASGYSLSFGPLRSPTPTGAGGRPFGSAGAGRGLRVLFALSTAARDTVGLGRCEDESVPSQTCAWRGVRSDVLEVQLDREVLARALHLPVSPHISVYLPISPCISLGARHRHGRGPRRAPVRPLFRVRVRVRVG